MLTETRNMVSFLHMLGIFWLQENQVVCPQSYPRQIQKTQFIRGQSSLVQSHPSLPMLSLIN